MAGCLKYQVLVVPTTHWDRAWYWHNERFRVKLIELFTQVEKLWKEHPDYKFTLDGQVIALEDYLEVFPEKAAFFREMGRQGRFKCGPLYVLSDMWLTSGESFIRNYLFGTELADSLDCRQKAVYQPDSFGFPPEMPMLVKGLGADSYITMRGIPDRQAGRNRFLSWRSPDGSEVKVLRLRDGYSNAAGLGLYGGTGEIMDVKSRGIHPAFSMQKALEKLHKVVSEQLDGQGEPHLLLAGGDHRIPQPELPAIMEAYKDDRCILRFSDLDEVVAQLDRQDFSTKPVISGEMNDWSAHKLGGTISTRMYLKAANSSAEQALTDMAEPLDAVLGVLGIDYPAGAVAKTAWKYLLKVHPHDNITGCSVDPVHREDEALIAHAAESANALRRQAIYQLVQKFGGQSRGDYRPGFAVFSTHGTDETHRVNAIIDFEGRFNWGDCPPPPEGGYVVVDENGAEVPFCEVRRGESTEHPHQFIELEISYRFRPFALTRFFFEKRNPDVRQKANILENEHIRAHVNPDGTVDMLHKATGEKHFGLGFFSAQGDAGDEYTFSPHTGETEKAFKHIQWEVSRIQGTMQAISLSGNIEFNGARIPSVLEYSLAPGERHLSCRIRFINSCKDYRLRWNVNIPSGTRSARAGIHFAEVSRTVEGWRELGDGLVEIPDWPADHFVAGENGTCGLAVFTPFPMSYEAVPDRNPHLAITICRAVGILSTRQKMLTNTPGAGPSTPVPEAQCLGRQFDFKFALRPFATEEAEVIFSESMKWRKRFPYGMLWGADPEWDGKPMPSLISLPGGTPVVMTAFKQVHRRDGRIVARLFNPTDLEQRVMIKRSFPADLSLVRLDEKPLEGMHMDPEFILVPPNGIASICFTAS